MKNWKTTLIGILTGIYPLVDAILTAYKSGQFTDKTTSQIVLGIGVIAFGLFAKDHDVTGGTVVNSPSNASAVKETVKKDN